MGLPRATVAGGAGLLAITTMVVGAGALRPRRDTGPPAPSAAPEAARSAPSPLAKGTPEGSLGVVLARVSADLSPRFEGKLREVPVRLGDRVIEGGVVARLDVPALRFELSAAEASLKAALVEEERAAVELSEAEERLARRASLSAESLASEEDVSAARYQQKLAAVRLSATRAQLAERRARVEQLRQNSVDADIHAPFAGVIAARYVDPGANVTPATPVVRLLGDDEPFVRFAIAEGEAPSYKVGTPVRAHVGGVDARAVVDKVAPEVDAASGLIVVEARLEPQTTARARPLSGEVARVTLDGGR